MTVGLAAIAAWGTDRFDFLVRGIDLSFTDPDYVSQVSQAGLTVFRGFFIVALIVSLAALLPTFLMKRPGGDVKLKGSGPGETAPPLPNP